MAQSWAGTDGEFARAVEAQNRRLQETYLADPSRVEQDANIERSIAEGAYARRQIHELVQNAADAMRGEGGRAQIILDRHTLYAANTGEALTLQGVETLMATHRSAKRDEQIGRFGLGFKSTLAVSDAPRIFSRSVSMQFDRARARAVLQEIVPGAEHYPAARLAWPLDPAAESAKDAVLAELMKWATTVVVLPVKAHLDVLQAAMQTFPAQFLLFSPHLAQLDLEDRMGEGGHRRLTVAAQTDGSFRLDDAGRRSSWVVRRRRHDPSKAALQDGGYHAARTTLEISWAAPLEGAPMGVGAFWAFFPTTSYTTLSGIVNAPWKLAEDRESLLRGPFNNELLTRVLPPLVADSLKELYRPERPGAIVDALPARGKESRSVADDAINEPVMRAVAEVGCIPTMGDTLGSAKRVLLHPEGLQTAELELWATACPEPKKWVHHALSTTERRSKVTRLLRYHNRAAVSHRQWLEGLVEKPTVEGSGVAVRLLDALIRRLPHERDELLKARVLLLSDGSLVPCRRGKVFLPSGGDDGLVVDPVLAGDRAVVEALKRLGIEALNDAGALQHVLVESPRSWDKVWHSVHSTTTEKAERILREVLGAGLLTDLRVRSRSGRWRSPGEVFLPGGVISAGGEYDPDFVVDARFHSQDLQLLERLGLVDRPRRVAFAPEEAWLKAAKVRYRDEYRHKTSQERVHDDSIHLDPGRILWPLEPLQLLSPRGRAAVTTSVLSTLDPDHRWEVWTGAARMHHGYLPDPVWRYLHRHGVLNTQAGLQPVTRCLARNEDAVIDGVPQPLPFVPESVTASQAKNLRLKGSVDELTPEDWVEMLNLAAAWPDDQRFLLYAWAAFQGQPAPARIKVHRGRGYVEVPPTEVAVTRAKDVFESLVAADIPCLLADSEQDEEGFVTWGLARGADLLQETLEMEPDGEPYRAADRYPPLRNIVEDDQVDIVIQPCSRLEILTSTPTGQRARPLTHRLEGSVLYLRATSDVEVLSEFARALGLGNKLQPARVLQRMELAKRNRLRTEIAEAPDLVTKLLLAIGVDELRQAVPADALDALTARHGELSSEEIARLAFSVDGYGVLQAHMKTLAARGLEPPKSWAATRPAREWVRSLGFPVEFAGFAGQSRAREIHVEGPPVLGPLHDYQRAIADKVKALLAPEAEERRGLIALPTGAGKTRVAVEALVEYLNEAPTDRRIVWLAETDELCEQAVQGWNQIWRALGTPGRLLTLSRLWAGNGAEERDGHQVVVASVAKIRNLVDRGAEYWEGDYGWLVRPDAIVVDEAHKSISQEYNQALAAIAGTSRVADMTVPLIGLTATPYRNYNELQTEALAGRYHRHRLSDGVFADDDVYGHLQRMGVLARVRQRELPGSRIELDAAERARAEEWNWSRLPESVEARLAQDAQRNATIVDAVTELEEGQRALLFAPSVHSARVLAAMLTYRGIEARAVSGTTDASARRRYVEDFKMGRVRVLTNYNVFTEGFDVPGIDAVFITRPTFSPNVYQQMVGRGLRGPLNGGKEEVLLVNVADNLTNFQGEFAFRHFDNLWGSRAAT